MSNILFFFYIIQFKDLLSLKFCLMFGPIFEVLNFVVLDIIVYLEFLFIGFMLLPFCPSFGVYIYLNTFNNNNYLS